MGLTSCCRCLDLRRGSIAIGIFYVAVSALGILLSIVFIAVGPEIIIRALLFGQIDFHTAIAIIFAMRILLWVSLILCVMMLIISALLIRGVLIDNSCMVLTYVIVQGLVLVLGTIGYIYQLITAISSGVALSITLAVLSMLCAAVQWYWYTVVVYYYQIMVASETVEKVTGYGVNRVQPTPPIGTVSGNMEP